MIACRTAEDALAFVEDRGAVLVSARGATPSLMEAIAGAPIKGSWWAHPQGHLMFELLNTVAESDQVLLCRLVDGKLTLVHRRLWPALVRLADRLPAGHLAQVRQEHTASGRHVNHDLAFPQWVPEGVATAAAGMTEQDAEASFGPLLPSIGSASAGLRRGARSPKPRA